MLILYFNLDNLIINDFFSSDHGPLSSPSALDLMTSPSRKSPSRSPESLEPGAPSPLASAVLTMPKCNVNLVKLGEPRSHIKLLDNIPSIPISVPPVTSPIPALPGSSKATPEDDEKSTGTVCKLISFQIIIFISMLIFLFSHLFIAVQILITRRKKHDKHRSFRNVILYLLIFIFYFLAGLWHVVTSTDCRKLNFCFQEEESRTTAKAHLHLGQCQTLDGDNRC